MIRKTFFIFACISRFVQVLLGLALLAVFVFFLNALFASRTAQTIDRYSPGRSEEISTVRQETPPPSPTAELGKPPQPEKTPGVLRQEVFEYLPEMSDRELEKWQHDTGDNQELLTQLVDVYEQWRDQAIISERRSRVGSPSWRQADQARREWQQRIDEAKELRKKMNRNETRKLMPGIREIQLDDEEQEVIAEAKRVHFDRMKATVIRMGRERMLEENLKMLAQGQTEGLMNMQEAVGTVLLEKTRILLMGTPPDTQENLSAAPGKSLMGKEALAAEEYGTETLIIRTGPDTRAPVMNHTTAKGLGDGRLTGSGHVMGSKVGTRVIVQMPDGSWKVHYYRPTWDAIWGQNKNPDAFDPGIDLTVDESSIIGTHCSCDGTWFDGWTVSNVYLLEINAQTGEKVIREGHDEERIVTGDVAGKREFLDYSKTKTPVRINGVLMNTWQNFNVDGANVELGWYNETTHQWQKVPAAGGYVNETQDIHNPYYTRSTHFAEAVDFDPQTRQATVAYLNVNTDDILLTKINIDTGARGETVKVANYRGEFGYYSLKDRNAWPMRHTTIHSVAIRKDENNGEVKEIATTAMTYDEQTDRTKTKLSIYDPESDRIVKDYYLEVAGNNHFRPSVQWLGEHELMVKFNAGNTATEMWEYAVAIKGDSEQDDPWATAQSVIKLDEPESESQQEGQQPTDKKGKSEGKSEVAGGAEEGVAGKSEAEAVTAGATEEAQAAGPEVSESQREVDEAEDQTEAQTEVQEQTAGVEIRYGRTTDEPSNWRQSYVGDEQRTALMRVSVTRNGQTEYLWVVVRWNYHRNTDAGVYEVRSDDTSLLDVILDHKILLPFVSRG